MARASGGANNMQPLSWWGHKQKRSKITSVPGDAKFICPLSRGRGQRLEQIIFLFLRHIICKKWIFSVCAPPPPSQYAMHPHTLCYHYLKIWHVCVGGGGAQLIRNQYGGGGGVEQAWEKLTTSESLKYQKL